MLSEEIYNKYETVVGLEVHAQLLTKSKAFSSDPYTYGSAPNTQVSPINLGHPGTLPKPNLESLRMAIKMGLACGCNIQSYTHYSRKNYFYADLPKGYQITQFTTPICTEGQIMVKDAEGKDKAIKLDKIILEEDSGKSTHDLDPFASLIDLNRAGVALIEIVSQPDIRTPEEAYQYLTEVRQVVRYLDICDGNLEEGSMRCDANVSIRLKGSDVLNTRVEIKNVNSIRNVSRAIAYETKRQIELVESGGKVTPDTRGFDAAKGETYAMRSKELANDYRYFPEPDIPPVVVSDDDLEKVKELMPELPRALQKRLVTELGLTDYDAGVITAEKETAEFYQSIIDKTKNYKAAVNWLNGPIRSYLNENAIELHQINLTPTQIAELIQLVDDNKINFSTASSKVFPELLKRNYGASVEKVVNDLNLVQVGDESFISGLINEVLAEYAGKVAEYKAGKKGVLGLFVGEVMKKSKGKADPKITNQLIVKALEE
ncbi:MAG: Asp-tRNA(Asn)/Glu-tRNA(Gln) amidotransferase subunit GatB [Bacteroidia bacterium]